MSGKPWLAKANAGPEVRVYVCARCRRSGEGVTLLKCGPWYGCKACVDAVGWREKFLGPFAPALGGARFP